MAKRRLLKKDISYIAGDLFTEALIVAQLIPGIDEKKAETVLTRIMDMNDEYIKRAHQPAGKDNKKVVRQYYNKLIEDLKKEIKAIEDEIESLSKSKVA